MRGYDLSNMTIIESKTGWVIVDPLTARETAAAAMAPVRKYLDDRPIVAMIFTHSHIDHFGGLLEPTEIIDHTPQTLEIGRSACRFPDNYITQCLA